MTSMVWLGIGAGSIFLLLFIAVLFLKGEKLGVFNRARIVPGVINLSNSSSRQKASFYAKSFEGQAAGQGFLKSQNSD